MIYIIQQNASSGRLETWDASDETDAIQIIDQSMGYPDALVGEEDLSEAVTYDKRAGAYAETPVELIELSEHWQAFTFDAIVERWGDDPEREVDLADADEWGEDTAGGALLKRFQADSIADLGGAELGRFFEKDVIYLPDAKRGAVVSNGDATWFDAESFRHASLYAH